jgi:hypothetical protein
MSAQGPLRAAGAARSRVPERSVPDSRVTCMMLTAIALLLAAPLGCAGIRGPRAIDATFAPPRTEREAAARLSFLEARLDAGRRHAELWYWSWLAINGTGLGSTVYTSVTTNHGDTRAFNVVQASQAALGVADMLWMRPMPGRTGADPLRTAAVRGASVDARVAEGERLLVASATRAESRRDWRLHAANLALQAVGAAVLLALDEPGYAGLTMALGIVGGEANFWSEPSRATGDLDAYRQLVATGAVPPTSWQLAPTRNGVALVLHY